MFNSERIKELEEKNSKLEKKVMYIEDKLSRYMEQQERKRIHQEFKSHWLDIERRYTNSAIKCTYTISKDWVNLVSYNTLDECYTWLVWYKQNNKSIDLSKKRSI